ncbi:GNAT family N-acetyltransferase [Candidatus Daviesbacteria bacterium]|nr:GNAT family N-acetyltransferase [Candidatus Daviesbacteria bacterium]
MTDPLWHYWVVKDGGKIVGFCIARYGEKRNILEAIHLLLHYQGQGIGKQLLDKALNWLGRSKDIELGVSEYNNYAISFYEKFGFHKTGKSLNDEMTVLPSGRVIPQIEMLLPSLK